MDLSVMDVMGLELLRQEKEVRKKVYNQALAVANSLENDYKKICKDIRKYEREKFYKLSKIKEGDRVSVKKVINVGNGIQPVWEDGIGIVCKVKVWVTTSNKIRFDYYVNKIKKNGEMSDRALVRKFDHYEESQLTILK